jgi:hypothetical protein
MRHADDGGEPAGGRGARAGGDGLLRRLPRLAEMHVHVDEPRANGEPCGVDDLRPFLVAAFLALDVDLLDLPTRDVKVADAVDAIGRVDDVAVGDEGCFQKRIPPSALASFASLARNTKTPKNGSRQGSKGRQGTERMGLIFIPCRG